jgi:hypothetical protein
MAKKIIERDERINKPGRSAKPYEVGEVRRKPGAPDPQYDVAPKPRSASLDVDQGLRDRHEMRKGWFLTEAHRQAANRARMARCESMYDSEQWSYQDAEDLRARGQNPVVYNEIKPTIDWMIGTERRARVDFVVVANMDDEGADDDATNKTKLLKYLDDTNNAHFERSWAAEDAFKAGIGWLEVQVRGDASESPVYVGNVSWRDILWDSFSRRRDLTDARYLFRVKVVDLDVAEAIFPDKTDELRRCAQSGDTMQMFAEWMGGMGMLTGLDQFNWLDDPIDQITAKPIDMFNSRKRVLLIECWERVPRRRKATAEGMGDPVTFGIRVSIMTEHDTLIEADSPFRHNRFPFVPIWAYVNRRTGLPYSPIWPLIGPQESLNHRMTKSLFEASANQLMVEKGAIDNEVMDIAEVREELNSPDGVAVFADGALSGAKVKPVEGAGRAETQLKLAERDIVHIRGASGVTGENRGLDTQARSGKAILAKQDQGSLVTAELFDNLLLGRKMEGELTLSTAEQYIVGPIMVRDVGSAKTNERITLNQRQPDGTYRNDITQRQAKFVIGEQAWKQAYAEAAFESLFDMLTQLSTAAPQVVVNLLDLVFDMHPNLPKKAAIVGRMRNINGQTDPDGKLTPEQAAERAKKAAMAKQEFELQMRDLLATVKEKEAKGEKITAEAMKTRMTTLYEAAQAAQELATVPETAPIADELARSVGFVDKQGDANIIDVQPAAPVPAEQVAPLPELQQADGALAGIETAAPDGVRPQPPARPAARR